MWWRHVKGEAKRCFCRSAFLLHEAWVLLGNGRGDSRRGNVGWFQCSLDMSMFLQVQFQSGVKRNAVWNGPRVPEQVDAVVVWISVSLQTWARERQISWCCRNQRIHIFISIKNRRRNEGFQHSRTIWNVVLKIQKQNTLPIYWSGYQYNDRRSQWLKAFSSTPTEEIQ